MANEVIYDNVNWAEGTPIAGERLATNGHYTGEFKGTPLQDAAVDIRVAYEVEMNTIRYGTLTPDAKDENFPSTGK